MKLIGAATIFLATSVFAFASTPTVPEIDGSSAASAVALIAGGFLVARSRRKNKK